LVGGTPCQSFSDAGLNKGMDDIRGRISLEYARILKEKRPKWFIWENVEGVFKNKHKKALCEIISSFTGIDFKPEGLDKQGIVQGEEYSIAYRVLDSQYFGVPQRRKRIYIVGYRGKNWKIPFSVLFEQGCFESVKEKNKSKRDEYTKNILGEIKLAGTITKSYGQTQTDGMGPVSTSNFWVDDNGIRCFTERELERLQGFPDGYLDFEVDGKKPGYSAVKGALGNSMTVNVMYWIGQRINFIDNYIESKKILKSKKN
jgi:DNA (cytosine-5)-methyltransferase 1